MNPNLGRETAINILDHEGHGAKKYLDLVYERCQCLLAGASAPADTEQNLHEEPGELNLEKPRARVKVDEMANATRRSLPGFCRRALSCAVTP
jgi:hypothetical protein